MVENSPVFLDSRYVKDKNISKEKETCVTLLELYLSSVHHFTISFQPKLSLVFIFCQFLHIMYFIVCVSMFVFGYFSLHIYYCQNQEALETYEEERDIFSISRISSHLKNCMFV